MATNRQRPLRAAIYARVSSMKQKEEGTSLEEQVENCQRRAKELDFTVVAEPFREVYTGSVLYERPELSQVWNMARNGELDVILINAFDRLSRSQTDGALFVREMDSLGVHIVECVKQSQESQRRMSLLKGM